MKDTLQAARSTLLTILALTSEPSTAFLQLQYVLSQKVLRPREHFLDTITIN